MTDAVRSPQQIRDEFQARRDTIVNEMGSSERIDRQHARGRLTVRERLDRLFDEGSFREIGTFAVSEVPNVRDRTPGDGKIGGWGEINGRAATACGDDVTVLHGSSSVVGGKRMKRIYEQALSQGVPYVYFGETGGARLPDALGSEGFSKIAPALESARPPAPDPVGDGDRRRIVRRLLVSCRLLGLRGAGGGHLAGGLQPAGDRDCDGREDLARRPRRSACASRSDGQIDQVAACEDDAVELLKDFLSYLPDNCWQTPPALDGYDDAEPDPELAELVPTRRQRAYDMHRVLTRIVDDGKLLELKPRFGTLADHHAGADRGADGGDSGEQSDVQRGGALARVV